MRGNSSRVSLALSATALFVALGGTAVAVSGKIGTSQIADGAITSTKLGDSAVTRPKLHNSSVITSKLANNAVTTNKLANQSVTTTKIADGAVTATQVAPNTFLPADGTALDSARLGGLLPADFVQGVGIMSARRVAIAPGSSLEFLSTGFGTFTGNCDAAGHMDVTWSPTVSDAEFEATIVQSPSTVSIDTLNGILAGGAAAEPPMPVPGALSINFQIGYTAGVDHVATAYVTGRFESGIGCVFVGQEMSTG